MKQKPDYGFGKTYAFTGLVGTGIAAPVVVNGRSIALLAVPEVYFDRLVGKLLESHPLTEGRVCFTEYNGVTVFVGMLQGKLVPCLTLDTHGHEVDAIADELVRRLEQFGTSQN